MNDGIDLKDFFRKYIDFTDKVLPGVAPVEQPVLSHLFARTLAVNKQTCQMSYQDLHSLTGLSTITIKKVLKSLMRRGLIRIVAMQAPRIAKTYEILWPDERIRHTPWQKLQRDPYLLLRELKADGAAYEGILGKLSSEEEDLLQLSINRLSNEEELHLRKTASELAGSDEDPDAKFKELVVLRKFGHLRLEAIRRREKATIRGVVMGDG